MKNLAIAILVFCAFIHGVHAFKCFECGSGIEEEISNYTTMRTPRYYDTERCLAEEKVIGCSSRDNKTCFRYHYITTDGLEKEARGCVDKQSCQNFAKICYLGTDEQKRPVGIKQCIAAKCCEGGLEAPCNSAYTFKCYECENDDRGVNYTMEQCVKDQKAQDCPSYYTCSKIHYITTRGDEKVAKGCRSTRFCKYLTNICNKGTDEEKRLAGIKECKEAKCCEGDGDKPCNGEEDGLASTTLATPITCSGLTVSINMFMIMFAALGAWKLF